ncbi:MAG: HD domain-containing protein, partial [Desulfurococcaceae archaeon]
GHLLSIGDSMVSEKWSEHGHFTVTSFNGQVRDPIYGYIDYIKELEGVIMDSWVLQRLRYIYQLQAAHFVYPGATHTRFSHSLGVMYSSYKYITFLLRSVYASIISSKAVEELRKKYKEIVLAARILGLLHDIGHGPFSHAFDKHVYRTRRFLGYRVGNHEVVGYIIYRDFIKELIEKIALRNKAYLGVEVDYLLDLLDAGMKPPQGVRNFTDLSSKGRISIKDFYKPAGSSGFERIVRMVIRDYIYTSDIMDYLKRDSYFTGVPIGQINDDWIVRNSFILEKDDKLVLAVSSKALDEVSRLFDARKLMYKYVYLHPVNVAFIETIGSLLECTKSYIARVLEEVLTSPERLVKYFTLTDHSLYSKLQELLVKSPDEYECEDKSFARIALESLFYQRKPVWKLVKRFTYDLEMANVLFGEIGERVQEAIKERIKEEVASRLSSKGILESDVNVFVDKIEVFPSAGTEIEDTIEVVDVKDGKVVYEKSMPFDDFATEYGLKSEALVSVYLRRGKYKDLSGKDLEEIIEISESVIENSIKGRRKEAPETS